MPSVTSYPNKDLHIGKQSLTGLLRRNIKDNLTWVFAMSLLAIMAEPFVLYLLGVTLPKLPKQSLFHTDIKRNFLQVGQVSQSLIAALSILAVGFLTYILFDFLFKREGSTLYFSLPFSRNQLFLNQYLSGITLISIVFFVEFVFMLLIFYLPPARLLPYFGLWLRHRLHFILAIFNYYNIFIASMILSGKLQDAIIVLFSLNALPSLIVALGFAYIKMSSANLIYWRDWSYKYFFATISPAIKLFFFENTNSHLLKTGIFYLLSLGFIILLFRLRPVERRGRRLHEERYHYFFTILWCVSGGLIGGFFIESILTNFRSVYIFLPSMLIFAFLALLLYFLLVGRKIKDSWKLIRNSLILLFVLFLLFDISVELKAKRFETYPPEKIEIVELSGYDFNHAWNLSGTTSNFKISLEKSKDPETVEKIFKLFQDSQKFAERQGFFIDSNRQEFRYEDNNQFLYTNSSVSMTFYDEKGILSKVIYYPQNDLALWKILAESPVYRDILDLSIISFQELDSEKDTLRIILDLDYDADQKKPDWSEEFNSYAKNCLKFSKKKGSFFHGSRFSEFQPAECYYQADLSERQVKSVLAALSADGLIFDLPSLEDFLSSSLDREAFTWERVNQRNFPNPVKEFEVEDPIQEYRDRYLPSKDFPRVEEILLTRHRSISIPGLYVEKYLPEASEPEWEEVESLEFFQYVNLLDLNLENTNSLIAEFLGGEWDE